MTTDWNDEECLGRIPKAEIVKRSEKKKKAETRSPSASRKRRTWQAGHLIRSEFLSENDFTSSGEDDDNESMESNSS